MKVFKLDVSDDVQWVVPERESFWDRYDFDGTSFAPRWRPVHVHDFYPKRRRKDFSRFGPGVFVVTANVHRFATPLLDKFAEFLPLKAKDHPEEALYVFNVTATADALDKRKTQWADDDEALDITRYAFLRSRLRSASLFRIPESPDIFVLERSRDAHDEFKACAELHHFTGLRFEEVWATA